MFTTHLIIFFLVDFFVLCILNVYIHLAQIFEVLQNIHHLSKNQYKISKQ